MVDPNKCFCDTYRECVTTPSTIVPIGHDVVRDELVTVDGPEFVERADRVCPGTRVFMSDTALNASNVVLTETTATVPRDAVTLQCEFFATIHRGM
jgi:hypothetical protein